jgi:ABC-type phosphate/phosphonate transport system permease subunit
MPTVSKISHQFDREEELMEMLKRRDKTCDRAFWLSIMAVIGVVILALLFAAHVDPNAVVNTGNLIDKIRPLTSHTNQ